MAIERTDEFVLLALECLRAPGDGFRPFVRIARPAWWSISDAIRSERRRRARLWIAKPPGQLPNGRMLLAGEALAKHQFEKFFSGRVAEVLRPRLSNTQRRYLDAVIIEIQLAAPERAGVRGVPARVAERLGKDPAQVCRALKRIAVVVRELGLEDSRWGIGRLS